MEFGDEGGFELAEPPMAMAAPAAAPKIEKTSAVAEPISMPAEPVPAAPAVPSRGPKDAPPATRGVYFVRIPRPAVTTDDATIKKLQAELASIVGQLRELNKQHMTKRVRAKCIICSIVLITIAHWQSNAFWHVHVSRERPRLTPSGVPRPALPVFNVDVRCDDSCPAE